MSKQQVHTTDGSYYSFLPTKLHPFKASIGAGLVLSINLCVAYILTFVMAPKYYEAAGFVYEDTSLFDTTWGTYVTDYILTIATGIGAIHLFVTNRSRMARASACMQLLYAISVLFGGLAHHFVHSDHMNTWYFRAMWTVTVLAVVLAGSAQGIIGDELLHMVKSQPRVTGRQVSLLFDLPQLGSVFWLTWGILLTVIVTSGGFSMTRPAADIFLAGVTQTWPIMYIGLILISTKGSIQIRVQGGDDKKKTAEVLQQTNTDTENEEEGEGVLIKYRSVLLAVFLLTNAPLIFAYPILLTFFTNIGMINFGMHCVLFVAWVGQYVCLQCFAQAECTSITTKRLSSPPVPTISENVQTMVAADGS